MKYSNGVIIDYTNWRGERRLRKILPLKLIYANNEYHPEEQWLLEGADLEDNYKVKTFSMKDVHSWIPEMRGGPHEIAPIDKWPFKKEEAPK